MLTEQLIESKEFRERAESLIQQGDPSVLTYTIIKRELEKHFELEEDELKRKEWKHKVNEIIDAAQEAVATVKEEPLEHTIPEGEEGFHTSSEEEEKTAKKRVYKKRKEPRKRVKIVADEELNKEEIFTVKSVSPNGSPNEETINRLKKFINKCGVRKIWKKELADCKSSAAQIKKLRSILADLGVEGRPTLEKCEAIRAARELQAELEGLDTDMVKDVPTERTRRRVKAPSYVEPEISSQSEEPSPSSEDEFHSDSE